MTTFAKSSTSKRGVPRFEGESTMEGGLVSLLREASTDASRTSDAAAEDASGGASEEAAPEETSDPSSPTNRNEHGKAPLSTRKSGRNQSRNGEKEKGKERSKPRRKEREKEIMEIVEKEKPRLKEVLREFRDRAEDVRDKVTTLIRKATEESAENTGLREDGASLLAAKQTLLLSYCRELCAYAAAKGRGEAFRGGGASWRLVELRTVMEKMRPLERKLKYQTDKLLRLATTPSGHKAFDEQGGGDAEDPLSFRPRPEAMTPWGKGDTDETPSARKGRQGGRTKSDQGGQAEERELYRAPRLASVPYDQDGPGADRAQRRLDKRRDKVRRGEVMEALRDEFGHQPESVRPAGNAGASGVSEAKMRRLLDEDKERQNFEEDHMVRLTITRKAKKARRQMERDAGQLETIADVGSSADFVRVAKDADGFGESMDNRGDALVGDRGPDGRRKRGSGALRRAMGAVGESMTEKGSSRGKKSKGSNGKKRPR